MSKLDVSLNAGAIFYLLENNNPLSLDEIRELTHCEEQQMLLAIGWLARDNRIIVSNNKDNSWLVSLNKFPMTEIHY